jgi:hypothetical protein
MATDEFEAGPAEYTYDVCGTVRCKFPWIFGLAEKVDSEEDPKTVHE